MDPKEIVKKEEHNFKKVICSNDVLFYKDNGLVIGFFHEESKTFIFDKLCTIKLKELIQDLNLLQVVSF